MLRRLFPHRFGHHAADVGIPLIGDDAFGVIVQLCLAVGNVLLQMGFQISGEVQLLQNLFIPLKNLAYQRR